MSVPSELPASSAIELPEGSILQPGLLLHAKQPQDEQAGAGGMASASVTRQCGKLIRQLSSQEMHLRLCCKSKDIGLKGSSFEASAKDFGASRAEVEEAIRDGSYQA